MDTKKFDLNPRKTLEGGAFIKHVFKKGGKNAGPLLIADLDEAALQQRLDILLHELKEYKDRVERYKKENAWYREEIAISQRDTEEYIRYLESKKNEKLDAVHKLAESNKKDLERFLEMKNKHESEHNAKITELKECIFELEEKLNSKEHEFLQLSDTIVLRY
jgi:septal ring factor EnvC (AmiA/AmiB activator)